MHQQWDVSASFETWTPGQGFCYHKCSLLGQLGKALGSLAAGASFRTGFQALLATLG